MPVISLLMCRRARDGMCCPYLRSLKGRKTDPHCWRRFERKAGNRTYWSCDSLGLKPKRSRTSLPELRIHRQTCRLQHTGTNKPFICSALSFCVEEVVKISLTKPNTFVIRPRGFNVRHTTRDRLHKPRGTGNLCNRTRRQLKSGTGNDDGLPWPRRLRVC
jgi:hypothetical protein